MKNNVHNSLDGYSACVRAFNVIYIWFLYFIRCYIFSIRYVFKREFLSLSLRTCEILCSFSVLSANCYLRRNGKLSHIFAIVGRSYIAARCIIVERIRICIRRRRDVPRPLNVHVKLVVLFFCAHDIVHARVLSAREPPHRTLGLWSPYNVYARIYTFRGVSVVACSSARPYQNCTRIRGLP